MFIVFFSLWVVFNGRITLDVALVGVVISAALYAFCWKFLGFTPRKEIRFLKKAPRGLLYLVTLIREIIKANIQLSRIVLSHKKDIHPKLVTFRTPLQKPSGRTLLANSITLTPGTITVYLKQDELTVHCLDSAFAQGIDDLDFQRRLLAMEEIDDA